MPVHSITFDIEDWHQLTHRRATGALIPTTVNVLTDTRRILELLAEAGVRATCFVQGYVAEAYPELVKAIHAAGHEIGSHTHHHELIWRMPRDRFAEDIRRSRGLLQDLTGQPVIGFRAPEFSVKHLGHWSFDELVAAGFEYDSSVFPLPRARYGIPEAPVDPFRIETPAGSLWEFPPATHDFGRFRAPIAGGSYYRLLPGWLLRRGVKAMDAGGRSGVFYFHPYEFHRGWLWLNEAPFRCLLRPLPLKFIVLHNFRTAVISQTVRSLLSTFRFAPLGERHAAIRGGSTVSPTNGRRP